MSTPIEDYALLGDLRGAALVSRAGSVDWLVAPRFDAPASLSALIGEEKDGSWRIAPADPEASGERRYRGDTLVLETIWAHGPARVRVTEAMIIGDGSGRYLVRLVEGLEGALPFDCRFVPRFDYGAAAPWLKEREGAIVAISGPDAIVLRSGAALERADRGYGARFTVHAGEKIPFVLTWFPSNEPLPEAIDACEALERTERWWADWSRDAGYQGPYRDAVVRSLITLKALSHEPTGAIVAAPTTSLPEALGGVRNWDYRFCWLRDATFTVLALLNAGHRSAAEAFVAWLTRAIAGEPGALQILYGVAGERRLDEYEVPWLAGYEGSRPVRIGNAAYQQFQLDVYGEVVDVLYQAVKAGIDVDETLWGMMREIVAFVREHWKRPDRGMWEIRGEPLHFVYSKVMAWVVFDRAVKLAEAEHLSGPVDAWRSVRDQIRAEILEHGFDRKRGVFVQAYGSHDLDANLLLIAQVGFLPADDERVRATVEAIERELLHDPFVRRYPSRDRGVDNVDGLPHREGAFLACSFWLVDMYALMGRSDDARALFERLLALRNDVGLLSEEYDIERLCMLGNFPQAFSHLALVNAAYNLQHAGPAKQRSSPVGAPISTG